MPVTKTGPAAMGGFMRGTWVRHRPSGIVGRLEVQDATLASVLPYPPDNAGWFTGRAADFESAEEVPCRKAAG